MYGNSETYIQSDKIKRVFIRGRFRLEIILSDSSLWVKTCKQFGPKEGIGLHETLIRDSENNNIFYIVNRQADPEVPITLVARRDINFPIGCRVIMKVKK